MLHNFYLRELFTHWLLTQECTLNYDFLFSFSAIYPYCHDPLNFNKTRLETSLYCMEDSIKLSNSYINRVKYSNHTCSMFHIITYSTYLNCQSQRLNQISNSWKSILISYVKSRQRPGSRV